MSPSGDRGETQSPWRGSSAGLFSGHAQFHIGPGQNSMFLERFYWRCLNICFFRVCGLQHPLRKWKIAFLPPFQSTHPTRLAHTGSRAAHSSLSPILGSSLGGQRHEVTAAQWGRLSAQVPLPECLTALLPAVNLHTSIASCKEWLPEARLTDRQQRSLWEELESETRFPKPKVYIHCCIFFVSHQQEFHQSPFCFYCGNCKKGT